MRNFNVSDVLNAVERVVDKEGRLSVRDLNQLEKTAVTRAAGYSVYSNENATGSYQRVVIHATVSHILRVVHLNEKGELCVDLEHGNEMQTVSPHESLKTALAKNRNLSETVVFTSSF